MKKEELAKALRSIYDDDPEFKKLVDDVDDDDIVESYVSCSCCGELCITKDQLDQIISSAKDVDHYFFLCDVILNLREEEAKN